MPETSKWDDYFVRVGRYLEYGDIESEELEYKREAAHELARYRDELLSRQTPITIKPNKDLSQLAGWRKFPDVLKWLRAGARTNADFGLRFRTEDGSCSCATVGPDEVQVRWKRTERRIF